MQATTTIGLDIANSVFQVHGIRRQLKRRYVLAFLRNCRHAWLASKPAPRRAIGRGSSRRSATLCA
jgi:hypothetical protein